jgi:D-glycero-alpha-D-manno-heptose-7-phosphate kinase
MKLICHLKSESMEENFEIRIVSSSMSLGDVLRKFEHTKLKTFYVVENGFLLGSITEGDVRRHILKHGELPKGVSDCLESDCTREYIDTHGVNKNRTLINKKFDVIPLVNSENKLIDFIIPNKFSESNKNFRDKHCAIAPVRISLAGGGSDVNYWFDSHRGKVINIAIAKFARVTLGYNDSNQVNICSLNTGEKLSLDVTELSEYQGVKLNLIVNCLSWAGINDGVDVEIFCDFEPGTGLGGSSALVVACIKACESLQGFTLTARELTKCAYFVERELSGINGGWQDHIISAHGGLCITKFENGDFGTYTLSLDESLVDFFNSCLFLVRVGNSRSSSKIHIEQKESANTSSYEKKMLKIVEIADEFDEMIRQHDFENFGAVLDKGWQLKRSLSASISNLIIDEAYEKLKQFGATGGRLIGAGASGYLLVFVPFKGQLGFLESCKNEKLDVERVKIETSAARTL